MPSTLPKKCAGITTIKFAGDIRPENVQIDRQIDIHVKINDILDFHTHDSFCYSDRQDRITLTHVGNVLPDNLQTRRQNIA